MLKHIWLLFLFVNLIGTSSFAKEFETSYLKFNLPGSWGCELKNITWLCRSQLEEEKKQALFVITAKQASPETTMQSLQTHFMKSKTLPGAGGRVLTSHVFSTQIVKINNIQWIQSIHLNSELENFYTYYLSTLYQGRSILFTFSFDKLRADHFKVVLNQAYSSLTLKKSEFVSQETPTLPQLPKGVLPTKEEAVESKSSHFYLNKKWIFSSVIILALLFLFYFLKPNNKKRKRKKNKSKGPKQNLIHHKRK